MNASRAFRYSPGLADLRALHHLPTRAAPSSNSISYTFLTLKITSSPEFCLNMLSLKSVIVFTIVACGFAAADLKADQKKYCTFSCGQYGDVEKTDGGCASITGHDEQGRANQWTIMKAFKTAKHDHYFNCIGTKMAFTTCCRPGSIVIPPHAKPPVMTLKGISSYPDICTNAVPVSPQEGDPQDCVYNP
ncbi:hypothetical protein H4Q26_007077 [Puccinia striiformis f. sp. tritici PST-130]|nr:hypothetical protein H4Q26_007077 [Puccinia striiformis f. sp. tritici PST-130]